MRCPHCGAELKEWTKFCPKCGGALKKAETAASEPKEQLEAEDSAEEPSGKEGDIEEKVMEEEGLEGESLKSGTFGDEYSPKEDSEQEYPSEGGSEEGSSDAKRSSAKKLVAGGLILLAVAALAGGTAAYKHHMNVKQQQERLASLIEGSEDIHDWMEDTEERFDTYVLSEDEQIKLDDYLEEELQLEAKDYEGQILLAESVKTFESEVKTRLDTEAAALLGDLKSQDPGYASDSQKAQLGDYAKKMEKLIADGKYKKLEPLAAEWRDYAAAAAVKKTGYDVSVMQYDFSEYPTVRVYVDVRDPAVGGTVKELSPNMFYVSERQAGTPDFLNRTIKKAVSMNENERLNINLLADTSSSMEGGSMEAAKGIMKNFLGTVQFQAGDRVKLTQFNSIIDKSNFFTGDSSVLNRTIDSFYPTGQTKLYDAIIYGVQDVAGQEGARCVLAFTDGMDVGSYYTAQNVVDIVSRYKIPVFIVRIGDSSNAANDDALRQIAAASGGSFKNMSQFSSDMNEFYNQIYRQLKEYYVVEYLADGMQGLTKNTDISVYIQNQEKGGEAVAAANPGNELFDSLLGSYLRSYIVDMNNHSYNQLAQYVDDTLPENDKWSIQWQMKKQVTGGFSNVSSETLMDYTIAALSVQDENTIRLKAVENYDVIYDEVYGDLKNSNRTVAADALKYLQDVYGYTELDDSTELRIFARVNQVPEYILKKGPDGKWKFSQYAGDLALGERRKVYDVEIMWQPYGW